MSYNEFAIIGNEASWRFAFAHRLRKILEMRNIKIVDFGRKTGISSKVLNSYLNGSQIPNYYRMMVMAEALNMPIETLTAVDSDEDLYEEYDDTED